MKKYLNSILCLLLALCMVVCFAACSEKKEDEKEEDGKSASSEKNEAEEPEGDDVITDGGSVAVPVTPPTTTPVAPAPDAAVDPKVGTYYLYAMGTEDDLATAEDIMKEANLTSLEGVFGAELKADGTGVMTVMGETDNITWNATQLIDSNGETVNYEFEDGILAFEIDGFIIAFIKK